MKQFKNVLIVIATFFLLLPVGSVFASPAKDQLKSTIDSMIQVLKDPQFKGEASKEKRRQALRKIVYERFDFLEMTKACLAKHRAGRSAAEIEKLSDLFGQLLEQTYVANIEGYTDEKVLFTKDRVIKKKNIALVYTKVVSDSKEIPIDYKLHEVGGIWKVIDMKIEGVLIVRNYRDQFDKTLRSGSFESLLEEIQKKIDS